MSDPYQLRMGDRTTPLTPLHALIGPDSAALALVIGLIGAAYLVIEQPEHGLYPTQIADMMDDLRSLTAVPGARRMVIVTQSPLVVNEMEPSEVSLVTRGRDGGVIITPMTETIGFEQRSAVYALGELWLAYAEGGAEPRLVSRGTT